MRVVTCLLPMISGLPQPQPSGLSSARGLHVLLLRAWATATAHQASARPEGCRASMGSAVGQWLRHVPALGGECEVGGEWLLRRVLSNKRAAVNTELLSIHRETKTVKTDPTKAFGRRKSYTRHSRERQRVSTTDVDLPEKTWGFGWWWCLPGLS